MTIQQIPNELIDDNPYNPRKKYDDNKIKGLAASIKEIGMRQIPEARKVGERYQTAYGGGRRRAYVELDSHHFTEPKGKWSTMPLDVKDLDNHQMYQYALHENLNRTDLTPLELARSIDNYFLEFPDDTEDILAKNLNLSQPVISNMRRVLKAPAKILDKVDSGRINFTQVRELLTFSELSAKNAAGVAFNDEQLMLEVIDKTVTPGSVVRFDDALPNTVEGIIKAIDRVAEEFFKPLQKKEVTDILFSAPDEGCMTKCVSCLITHPKKGISRHWCLNSECWEGKQKAFKESLAAAEKELLEKAISQLKNDSTPPQTDLMGETVDENITEEIKPSEIKDIHQRILAAGPPPAAAIKAELEKTETPDSAFIEIKKKLKSAEVKAMCQARDSTKTLDKGRMLLILEAQIKGYHIEGYIAPAPADLFWRDIDPDGKVKTHDVDNLFKKLEKLPEADLAKMITEFCLYALQDKSEIASYKINLQDTLNRMGVKVEMPEMKI